MRIESLSTIYTDDLVYGDSLNVDNGLNLLSLSHEDATKKVSDSRAREVVVGINQPTDKSAANETIEKEAAQVQVKGTYYGVSKDGKGGKERTDDQYESGIKKQLDDQYGSRNGKVEYSGITVKRLNALPIEQLKALSPIELLNLNPDGLAQLTTERLRALSSDQLNAILKSRYSFQSESGGFGLKSFGNGKGPEAKWVTVSALSQIGIEKLSQLTV